MWSVCGQYEGGRRPGSPSEGIGRIRGTGCGRSVVPLDPLAAETCEMYLTCHCFLDGIYALKSTSRSGLGYTSSSESHPFGRARSGRGARDGQEDVQLGERGAEDRTRVRSGHGDRDAFFRRSLGKVGFSACFCSLPPWQRFGIDGRKNVMTFGWRFSGITDAVYTLARSFAWWQLWICFSSSSSSGYYRQKRWTSRQLSGSTSWNR